MSAPHTATEFSALADGIAQMREFGRCAPDERLAGFVENLADEFTKVLDFMAESEDVLTGDMPWWTERQPSPGYSLFADAEKLRLPALRQPRPAMQTITIWLPSPSGSE